MDHPALLLLLINLLVLSGSALWRVWSLYDRFDETRQKLDKLIEYLDETLTKPVGQRQPSEILMNGENRTKT